MRGARHAHHDLFGDGLDRAREIHLALRHRLIGRAPRSVEQALERLARHRQAAMELEVLEIELQAAVLGDVDEMIANRLHVLRLAVRREPHHLVFALVDGEAGEIGEGGIQQADGMRKMRFVFEVQLVAAAGADR